MLKKRGAVRYKYQYSKCHIESTPRVGGLARRQAACGSDVTPEVPKLTCQTVLFSAVVTVVHAFVSLRILLLLLYTLIRLQ